MENYRIDDFLNVTWLRPENVVWDCIASSLIGNELLNTSSKKILEIGIGNGYFTFMSLGGKFKKEYDWYYNVNTKGFLANEDIYDTITQTQISQFIEKETVKNIELAIDHKKNLIKQAKQLSFINNSIVQDANKPINFDKNIDTVYSNILYWLNDPIKVLKDIDSNLQKSSKIILVFPNKQFYEYCTSYTNKSKIWTLLNRGRAQSIMWSMNITEFEKELKQHTNLEIKYHTTYLSKQTLKTWDIGFRPFSAPLIKMANLLQKEQRQSIKEEWVTTVKPYIKSLLENELNLGSKEGGFNFCVLQKK